MAKTFEQIATTTLTSTTNKIQFTSLGSYTDIHIVASYACSTESNVYITLNNDYSTSAYYAVYIYGTGSTSSTNAQNTIYTNNPNTLTSTEYVTDLVQLLGVSDTDKYKYMDIRHVSPVNAVVSHIAGTFKTLAAVSSIEYNATGAFAIGTTITLFGLTAGSA